MVRGLGAPAQAQGRLAAPARSSFVPVRSGMTVIADTAAGGSAGKGPGPEPESGAVVEAAAPADSPPGRADDDRKVEATPLPGPAAASAASAAARKADHGAAEPGPSPGRSLAGRLSVEQHGQSGASAVCMCASSRSAAPHPWPPWPRSASIPRAA